MHQKRGRASANMTAQLGIEAFNRARSRGLIKRGAIIHTDRGSQYASVEYRRLLYIHGYRQSMAGRGNCCGQRAGGRASFPALRRNLLRAGVSSRSHKLNQKSSVMKSSVILKALTIA